MKRYALATLIFCCLLAGTSHLAFGSPQAEDAASYEDLTEMNPLVPERIYRLGETGICGTVEKNHILVTHVMPGSIAAGKILKGDRIRGLQHRGMSGWGGIQNLVRVRLYRIGRDWDWHLHVTVERSSLRKGKGNIVTYDLRMPPSQGGLCHYGPTGFFAKRHPDRLVVDIVEKDSPADGKLQKGDVIVAVDGQPITVDAYKQFTKAIDKAESIQGGGKLKLTVRRPPAQHPVSDAQHGAAIPALITVTLKLKVMGSYTQTAPVDCLKTDGLITQAADHLVESRRFGILQAGLLGLLATGEEKYINVVRDHLHAADWAQPPKDLNELVGTTGSYVAWHWGSRALLLTEYYLRTGDEFVLPAIFKYARGLASGQDQAGLWGHQMCHKGSGRSYGYGVMNQPTLTIFLALILAEKCGENDPMVRAAIKRTHDHYNKWIGRGALPYGNHAPVEQIFTNNGTSGSLALAFALLGNERGARFYATMSAAATDEILTGHGGPWWNILWSGLGANLLGPEMTAAYNRKVHWLRTVTRTWNGGHVDILGWGSNPKPGKLSDTGSHLLNLCAGRRAIYITGKKSDKSLWVTRQQAEEIIESGSMNDLSEKTLLGLLGSPLPPLRLRAAQQLAKQDADIAVEVMNLLANGTPDQGVGAIHAIRNLKIAGTAGKLLSIAKDEEGDLWVRQLAVKTLGHMKEAKSHAHELLKVLVRDKPYDPYGELDIELGSALVKLYGPDPYATDLDKNVFYQGVTKLLDHRHSSGRGAGMALLKNIPMEDLPRVGDQMIYVIKDKDRAYTSYTGAGRQEALEILYRLGVRESMDYTVNTIKEPTGRAGPRIRARMAFLKTFGAEAKHLIPRIREALGKQADPIIEQIKASTTAREMVPFEEAKKMGNK